MSATSTPGVTSYSCAILEMTDFHARCTFHDNQLLGERCKTNTINTLFLGGVPIGGNSLVLPHGSLPFLILSWSRFAGNDDFLTAGKENLLGTPLSQLISTWHHFNLKLSCRDWLGPRKEQVFMRQKLYYTQYNYRLQERPLWSNQQRKALKWSHARRYPFSSK